MMPDDNFKSRYLESFVHKAYLGAGGFGKVFKATHKILKMDFAVKRIPLPESKVEAERVFREARTLAKLNHQNVVGFNDVWVEKPPEEWQRTCDEALGIEPLSSNDITGVDSQPSKLAQGSGEYRAKESSHRHNSATSDSSGIIFEDPNRIVEKVSSSELDSSQNDEENSENNSSKNSEVEDLMYLYIQMEFCEKGSLADWLESNTTSRDPEWVGNIFLQLLRAVEYIHGKDLIHRDIKPANIFFSTNNDIKLGDFGLVTEDSNILKLPGRTLYKRSSVGTIIYISPEQEQKKAYNNAVDIYSSGLVLFELLVPFRTHSERYKLLTQVKCNNFPKEFVSHFEKEHHFLKLLLSNNPKKRIKASEAVKKWSALIKEKYEGITSNNNQSVDVCLLTPRSFGTVYVLHITIAVSQEKVISSSNQSVPFPKGGGSFCWVTSDGGNFPVLSNVIKKNGVDFWVTLKLPVTLVYNPGVVPSKVIQVRKDTKNVETKVNFRRTIPNHGPGQTWNLRISQVFHCKELNHPLPIQVNWDFRVQPRPTFNGRTFMYRNEYHLSGIYPDNPIKGSFMVVPYDLDVQLNEDHGGGSSMLIKDKNRERGCPLIELYDF